MTQAELTQQLTDLKAQVDKVKTEIQSDLDKLAEAIANQGNVSPEVEAALSDLKASVQSADDLNTDV